MKQLFILAFLSMSLVGCATCSKNPVASVNNNNTNPTGTNVKIKIGNSSFTATLYDNATAAAFKSLLPLTVEMVELNGNEKYVDLPRSLPMNAFNPGTIQKGDLMLYGSKTLVLFYKSFSTAYSYTPMGRIDNTSGLATALGSGNVTIRFEAE